MSVANRQSSPLLKTFALIVLVVALAWFAHAIKSGEERPSHSEEDKQMTGMGESAGY